MKLIDGHAMIQRVEALHKRGTVDLSYYNIVKEAVQMEPSVDAVPVEWLKWRVMNAKYNGIKEAADAFDFVLNCWKEQEAQNEYDRMGEA